MSEPVNLKQVRLKPDETIVKTLECLLEKARSGEMRELIYIWKSASEGYFHGVGRTDNCMEQLGQIHRMAHRAQTAMDRVAEPG